MLKNKLEIFIITYNRQKSLENTFKELLSDISPVKDFSITVIDNNSEDNTIDIVNAYQQKYSNIKYIKNKYNIGGNANITKAFYLAEKEYVWVLADNDHYSWESWGEVEEAVLSGKDAVMVGNYAYPDIDVMHFVNQATFLPSVIYRTSNIDDTVIGNMAFNIPNMFPHMMLFFKLMNEKREIPICSNAVVVIGNNIDKKTNAHIYTRGFNDAKIHPLQKDMSWDAGFANSLHLLKDKNLRNYIVNHRFNGPKLNSVGVIKRQANLYNVLSIFCILSLTDKAKYLFKVLYSYTFYYLIYIYPVYERYGTKKDNYNKRFEIRFLNFIKIKTKRRPINHEKLINKKWQYKERI